MTIVLTLLVVPALGQEGKKGTVPGGGKPEIKAAPVAGAKGAGLQQALDAVKSGRSLEEIGRKIAALNLSAPDKKKLAESLQQAPYAGILRNLTELEQGKAETAFQGLLHQVERRHRQLAAEKNRQILLGLNLQAQQKAASLKATAVRRVARPAPMATPGPATAQAPQRSAGSGPIARVVGVSPQPAVVGGSVTISGEHFGPTARKVILDLGSSGVSECVVDSWEETRVVVSFPDAVREAVGETQKRGRIYIVLSDVGQDIVVVPDPASLVPAITSLTSPTIRPGQSLVVEGDNFLTERRGTVTFRFADRTIDGSIDDWAETYVAVRLPADVEGLLETAGVVKVRNRAGQEVSHSITFQPNLGRQDVWESIRGRPPPSSSARRSSGSFSTSGCSTAGPSRSLTWRCTSPQASGAAAASSTSRSRGGDRPRASGETWMDFFGFCDCSVYVTIEGPAGMPYQ